MPPLVSARDVRFNLWEVNRLHEHFGRSPMADLAREDIDLLIDQAERLAQEAILPTNRIGDEEGLRLVEGTVRTPGCFKTALTAYREAGWLGIMGSPEYGGAGLPHFAKIIVSEFVDAANPAFNHYVSLVSGVGNVLESFAAPEQKRRYLPPMYEGRWGGAMNLTEPSVGTALGDLKTTARRLPNGRWSITGRKQFITAGNSDLFENVVHIVLARAEGSPMGSKGISLFIVPQNKVDDAGRMGGPNDVVCAAIEHKMGIHASATCQLAYGQEGRCEGELVGGIDRGLVYMFQLMNEARFGTGLQGLCASSAAYHMALRYAGERIQGTAWNAKGESEARRVAILEHPDVRRMLLTQKVYIDGMRALIYKAVWTKVQASQAPADRQHEWEDVYALLTPIVKAYLSDRGVEMTSMAVQCFGGYGYCRDYGVEQQMRDARIAPLYEGCNGIQALDLVGRKVLNPKKALKPFNDLTALMRSFAESNLGHPRLGRHAATLIRAIDRLAEVTLALAQAGMAGRGSVPVMMATPYLEFMGDIVLAWLLMEQWAVADPRLTALLERNGKSEAELAASDPEAAFYAGKAHGARFYMEALLPKAYGRADAILGENLSPIEIPTASLGA